MLRGAAKKEKKNNQSKHKSHSHIGMKTKNEVFPHSSRGSLSRVGPFFPPCLLSSTYKHAKVDRRPRSMCRAWGRIIGANVESDMDSVLKELTCYQERGNAHKHLES